MIQNDSDVHIIEYSDFEEAVVCEDYLPENTNSSSEYFSFTKSMLRMDSKGNFTFSFSNRLESDTFKPKNSTITVKAKATSSTDDQKYYISLYKVGKTEDEYVKGATFKADGTAQRFEFSSLDTGSKYFLVFTKPITSNGTITGSGSVNYIK